MITKRNLTMVVGILAASFLGGIVGQRLFPAQPAFAQAAGQAQVQQTVTAEEFILVDGDGEIRARLDCNSDGSPSLYMYRPDGTRGIALRCDDSLTGLLLYDESLPGSLTYSTVATLVAHRYDRPELNSVSLTMNSHDAVPLVEGAYLPVVNLSADSDGGKLAVRGLNWRSNISVDAKDDAPSISMVDGDGKTRAELRYEHVEGLDTMAALSLYDDSGIALQIDTSNGSRGISLWDADGNELVSLHTIQIGETDTLIGLDMTAPQQQTAEHFGSMTVRTLSLSAGAFGSGLWLHGNDGTSRIRLWTKDNSPTIELLDSDETVIWQRP